MPFQSEKQRRYLHANKPEMAREWERHTKDDKNLPKKVGKMVGKKCSCEDKSNTDRMTGKCKACGGTCKDAKAQKSIPMIGDDSTASEALRKAKGYVGSGQPRHLIKPFDRARILIHFGTRQSAKEFVENVGHGNLSILTVTQEEADKLNLPKGAGSYIVEGTLEKLELKKGGPFIGPRGGKWKDPKHTIPWTDRDEKFAREKKRPSAAITPQKVIADLRKEGLFKPAKRKPKLGIRESGLEVRKHSKQFVMVTMKDWEDTGEPQQKWGRVLDALENAGYQLFTLGNPPRFDDEARAWGMKSGSLLVRKPKPMKKSTNGGGPQWHTPPMPDFEFIYHQPDSRDNKKRERDARANRRRAAARYNSGRYGVHGEPGEPEIRFEGDAIARIERRPNPKRTTPQSKAPRMYAKMSDKPPPGFHPAPKSKKGAFRRKKGSRYEYWYPGQPWPEDAKKEAPKLAKDPRPKYKQKFFETDDDTLFHYADIKAKARNGVFRSLRPDEPFEIKGLKPDRSREAVHGIVKYSDNELRLTITKRYVAKTASGKIHPDATFRHRFHAVDDEGNKYTLAQSQAYNRNLREWITGWEVIEGHLPQEPGGIGSDEWHEWTKQRRNQAIGEIKEMTPLTEAGQKRAADVLEHWHKRDDERREAHKKQMERQDEEEQRMWERYQAREQEANDEHLATEKETPPSPYKKKTDTKRYNKGVDWTRGKLDDPDRMMGVAARKAREGGQSGKALEVPNKFTPAFERKLKDADPFWFGVYSAAKAHKKTAPGKKKTQKKKREENKREAVKDAARKAGRKVFKRHAGEAARSKSDKEMVERFAAGADWMQRKQLTPDKAKKIAKKKARPAPRQPDPHGAPQPKRKRPKNDDDRIERMFGEDPFWAGVYHAAVLKEQSMGKALPTIGDDSVATDALSKAGIVLGRDGYGEASDYGRSGDRTARRAVQSRSVPSSRGNAQPRFVIPGGK